MQPQKAQLPMEVTELPMVTEVRPVQPEKALHPMVVTGKIITLQKSFRYLVLNGNQVTIQKRAELHILSRYTHGQKLNIFIGFCYLFLGYFMSFSYLFPFGNDFLFSYDRFIVRPRFPRLTASLLGCPFIAVVYSWASLRECYGNGVTRRQHANFSLCHSFRTASMTAVCRGDKGGLVEKQSGIQHSVFLASQQVRRGKYRELSAIRQSPPLVHRNGVKHGLPDHPDALMPFGDCRPCFSFIPLHTIF